MDAHLKAQVNRFVRTSALAFLSGLALTGGHVSWASLWALLVGSGETAWREVYPVRALPDRITSALAAAGPGLGSPTIPQDAVESTPRTAPGTGVPMQGVEVPRRPDGAFGPSAIGNPPSPPGA